MARELKIEVTVTRKNISPKDALALSRLEEYDWIIFTSKHAVQFFAAQLREQKIRLPQGPQIAAVGLETARALQLVQLKADMVPAQFEVAGIVQSLRNVHGKRILFPRSAVAPQDAIEALRLKGAVVRTLLLYTVFVPPLPIAVKLALLKGKYTSLYFSSPSGVAGFMKQLNSSEKNIVQKIPVRCIGRVTAKAARIAGFKKVSISK